MGMFTVQTSRVPLTLFIVYVSKEPLCVNYTYTISRST